MSKLVASGAGPKSVQFNWRQISDRPSAIKRARPIAQKQMPLPLDSNTSQRSISKCPAINYNFCHSQLVIQFERLVCGLLRECYAVFEQGFVRTNRIEAMELIFSIVFGRFVAWD